MFGHSGCHEVQTNSMYLNYRQILPLCYLYLIAASCFYTCAQDRLDTVQLVLVVFFLPPTNEYTPLAVMVIITCCNLRWGCFSLEH